MGAAEGVLREQDPLLPEQSLRRPKLCGSGPQLRTLLGASVGKSPKAERPSPLSPASHPDSDLSTTASGRSQDAESEEALSPGPCLSPQTRLIILDWDDTLLPTSFLRDALKIYPSRCMPSQRRKGKRSSTCGLPCQSLLDSHCDLVREMLLTCRSMAQVAIVTLAERPWVLDSADHFLPGLNLKRLLRDLDIPVYYAVEYRKPSRTPLLPETPPATSKRMAMEDFICSLQLELGARFNILSVGDSMAEREAARKAAMSLERRALRAGQPVPWCKTIKFQTDPSVKMLSMELRAVLHNLERFLALDHDLDLMFEQQDSVDDIEEKVLESLGLL